MVRVCNFGFSFVGHDSSTSKLDGVKTHIHETYTKNISSITDNEYKKNNIFR